MYILAQTFYIDPNAAANSTSVFVTGLDLYLKSKPQANNNRSGISNPGLHVSICDTNLDGSPNFTSIYPASHLDVAYSTIVTEPFANTATSLTFTQPIPLASGKKYALRIQAYDPDYELWTGTAGYPIVGTNTKLSGFSAGFQGALFDYASDGTVTPRAASQLKHAVYIAQFTANSATYEYVNDDMEFLTITGQSSAYVGGDIVFTKYANVSAQTVIANSTTVTGTGTTFLSTFTSGSYIAVWGTAANTLTVPIVRRVVSIANNTTLTIAEPYSSVWRLSTVAAPYFKTQVGEVYYTNQYANTIYLKGSTANSTLYFQAGQSIAGSISAGGAAGGIAINGVINATISSVDNLSVSKINPEVAVRLSAGGSANIQQSLAYYDGSNYTVSNSNFSYVDNLKTTSLTKYNSLIMSRSNEVQYPTNLYNSNKSSIQKITIKQANTSNSVYSAPYVDTDLLSLHVGKYLINNDTTNEAIRTGNALSKHITTKLTFDSGKSSEGLFVYLTAFQPAGTSVLAYAKLHNTKDSDAFDDKKWTQLVTVNNTGGQVSTTAANNYVEIDFGLPTQPPSLNVAGVVTTTAASATVTGSATNFGTDILVNDVVKIYSSTAPNTNYFIATVASIANTTQLTLNSLVATNTVINGSGLYIDKVTSPYEAFINPQNFVVRYYGTDLTEYDTFDVAQFKIVLLSNNVNIVPRVNSLKALGVSA